jgi:hypothetical protein
VHLAPQFLGRQVNAIDLVERDGVALPASADPLTLDASSGVLAGVRLQ